MARSKRKLTGASQASNAQPISTITLLDEDNGNVSSQDEHIEQVGGSSKKSKPTAERSWVWNHFTKCTVKVVNEIVKEGKKEQVEEMVLKAKCKYCEKLFACDTSEGGTSSYGKHIKKSCKKYKPNEDLQQKTLGGGNVVVDGDVRSMLVARGWSQEESVKEFIFAQAE